MSGEPSPALSIGTTATLACLLEAAAPKAGNVHPAASFSDLTFADLAISAAAIAPAMEEAPFTPVGATILKAVRATRALVHTNSNLGTVLLLAPLAKIARHQALQAGIGYVLETLTVQDARLAYQAIQDVRPGGLGTCEQADVREEPHLTLLDAMRLAADRDLVARQYATSFQGIFTEAVPWLLDSVNTGMPLGQAIVQLQLRLLAANPDSLIERKCGRGVAYEASSRAADVLRRGKAGDPDYLTAFQQFDRWLRSDGNRRNPGTTADLIAAALFVAIRERLLRFPLRFTV
jgi:triphosphoribosyl-dephospho-CoA synthase